MSLSEVSTLNRQSLMLKWLCHAQQQLLLYTALGLWSTDGIIDTQVGDVQETATHLAILAQLAVGTNFTAQRSTHRTAVQQIVLASIQAFTRCFAAPGGLQHVGKYPAQAALPEYSWMCLPDVAVSSLL